LNQQKKTKRKVGHMSELAQNIRQEIIELIEKDQLTLPTLPEVALKVKEIAEDVEATIADISKVLGQDAALTARIIRVTNSPLLRAPQEVKDLNMAIGRLGINYTANLVIGLAMEQMFQATSDMIDQRMRKVWKDTTEITALSVVIAGECSKLAQDEVALASLVHKLGSLPVLTYAEENDQLISDGISLDKITNQLHPALGKYILTKWEFPEVFSDVPATYRKLDADNASLQYSDIIRAAYLVNNKGNANGWGKKDWSEVPAMVKLGLVDNDELVERILEKAVEAKNALS
jgi:HD-like signal output (HDOD) protein